MTQSKRHQIRLVFPESAIHRTGNHCTASQWAGFLKELGHQISDDDGNCDLLIAVHAARSHDKIVRFQQTHPTAKIVVALAGSDIYPSPNERAVASIAAADRVVALQPNAIEQVPPAHRHKVRVIVQSARPSGKRSHPQAGTFPACVVGHLRDVKDPLRAAQAARLLPPDSQIEISHVGGILEPRYRDLVDREMRENSRYHWLGEQNEQQVADLIASSQLMILTSRFEGGARVVGEALVHGTPVISSRIAGVVGLLGENYPGFFPAGDSQALADLLQRAEADSRFLAELQQSSQLLAAQFHPDRERQALRDLLEELDG